jgi:hypothetical protein
MILQNCEIWFAKLARPSAKYNKVNPTWECQIRTTDKAVRKEWEAAGLPVKAIVPDEGETYFRVNLRKRSIKKDGEKADPVEVVDGKRRPIDPNTIGNGSIGNIRLWQYQYDGDDGEKTASVLMAVQITKHIVYTPKPREDYEFKDEEYEMITPEEDTVEF